MRSTRISLVLSTLVCFFAVLLPFSECTLETEQPVLEGSTVRLTILRTSDIHSRLFPYDLKPNTHDQGDGLFTETAPYGGVERIAALIDRERERGDRLLYLDSGDVFQGAPIFNFSKGEVEFRWLSTIGVDAVVVGNHEFDAGATNLANQAEKWINYPFLSANYVFEDWTVEGASQLGKSISPFTIVNARGLRAGIIGMGDVDSMYSITQGTNSAGITPLEANETMRAYVEFVSPATDLIVVLSHLGMTGDQEMVEGHEVYMTPDKDVSAFLNRSYDPWTKMTCEECEAGVVKYWVPGVRGIDLILGGHLHVLTHPPMQVTDPAGRKVIIEHPSAFAKFMTRLDFGVAVPYDSYQCDTSKGLCTPEDNHFSHGVTCTSDADCARALLAPYGAEIVAHEQTLFPIDTIWCAEPRPTDPYDDFFMHDVRALADYCGEKGHAPTRNLLEPYRLQMESDPRFVLSQIFGYAPKEVPRKDSATGGDSALGNLTAMAMMIRSRVEAEFCVTNTLGIRDDFYPGVLDMETVFNVFPFENTITVMYLSGREIQEMFDFVTERSATRGCQSQAQIAGSTFVMNCGQAQRNDERYSCHTAEDCCQYRPEICEPDYEGTARWECLENACYSHPAEDITVAGAPLTLDASYKLATNDYIAAGGSGFDVLRRNTTKINTGIAMRDALVEFLQRFPTCNELLAADPNEVDPYSLSYCLGIRNPEAQEDILVKGACTCGDILKENYSVCPSINPLVEQFCHNPLEYPIIVAESDGRIGRSVK